MRAARFGSLVVLLALITAGCELSVQLNRVAVPDAPDAGCSICTEDAGEDAVAEDAPSDSADAGTDGAADAIPPSSDASPDGGADGPVSDASAEGDG